MSRYSNGEYGTQDEPPWESAAEIALNVARSFFQTTEFEYTPEESEDYLEKQIIGKVQQDLDEFENRINHEFAEGGENIYIRSKIFRQQVLERAINKAWYQINEKRNHYDGARTAMAVAQWFLDGC